MKNLPAVCHTRSSWSIGTVGNDSTSEADWCYSLLIPWSLYTILHLSHLVADWYPLYFVHCSNPQNNFESPAQRTQGWLSRRTASLLTFTMAHLILCSLELKGLETACMSGPYGGHTVHKCTGEDLERLYRTLTVPFYLMASKSRS